MVRKFRELARRGGNTLRVGNVDFKKSCFAAGLREGLGSFASGICISCADEDVKPFCGELARYFTADAFVCSSDECFLHNIFEKDYICRQRSGALADGSPIANVQRSKLERRIAEEHELHALEENGGRIPAGIRL